MPYTYGENDNLEQQAFELLKHLMLTESSSECHLADIAEINPKRTLKKSQPAKCIDMSMLSTKGAFPSGYVVKEYTGGMRFTNGDTLLARITPCLENGKAAFISFLDHSEVAFGSTEYIVLSPKSGIPAELLYSLTRFPAFVDYAVKHMNGSSGRQRVSADEIGQFTLPMLRAEALSQFASFVAPIFQMMKSNWLANQRLTLLRDTLLPRLMSGEIDVSAIKL